MLKYGYNDTQWDADFVNTRFSSAVQMFCLDGYQSMMKRKTATETDLKALAALTEMVELLNERVKNLPVK